MQFIRKYPFLPAVIFFFITVFLLTLPGSSFPKSHFFDIPYFDKWVHIGLFGTLCFLFSYPIISFTISIKQKRVWLVAIFLLCSIYGVAMEYVQEYWVINRSFDAMDMLADSIGSLVAMFISFQLLHKYNKSRV